MPLPTPNLDDRRFQDIVDHAKSLIPHYCPEWTDHNVSDPGVTLIELFAWMTDMLLYRVNQVPDKTYITLLELIGIRLERPRAAGAPVTFYLSAAQPAELTIPEGVEVATIQTETSPAIVFTTETSLTIRPPTVAGVFTRFGSTGRWIEHDLRQLDLPGQQISIFSPQPIPGDAFYLAFEADHSHHVLALTMACEMAGGAGVDPTNPPLEWQVWQGEVSRWARCDLEYDGTGGFNQPGEVIMHTPAMTRGEFQGQEAFWLRCHLTAAQAGPGGYQLSPDLERLRVEARGGTTRARHATSIHHEILGRSDGRPGQTFRLLHRPILTRDPERDTLVVEPPGAAAQVWREVEDFGDSLPDDPHYTLDELDGTLTLGPALLQPDGTVYRFGRVPPKGSTLRFQRYQFGGGVSGNVPREALSVLKSSIPYVRQVINREAAVGGRDAQSLDDARLRAPQALRTRTRAVTVDDFEYLACQEPGVARARCLAPGAQRPDSPSPRPGHVIIVVLPQADLSQARLTPEQLTLSAELRTAVLARLSARCLLGTRLDIHPPHYTWVAVRAVLRLPEQHSAALAAEVKQSADAALYRFVNPYLGGAQGTGWPFGRSLHLSEIFGVLQRVPFVDFVEEVSLITTEQPDGQSAPTQLTLPPHGLICSAAHEVIVR